MDQESISFERIFLLLRSILHFKFFGAYFRVIFSFCFLHAAIYAIISTICLLLGSFLFALNQNKSLSRNQISIFTEAYFFPFISSLFCSIFIAYFYVNSPPLFEFQKRISTPPCLLVYAKYCKRVYAVTSS